MHSGKTAPAEREVFAEEDLGYHKALKPRQIQMIAIGGAIGTGLFLGAGGRLAQAGLDVTFLVRPERARVLDAKGLVIVSPFGNATVRVKHVLADTVASQGPFDLVLLSSKAYDLRSAIEAIDPAVGERSTVLPILNGLAHYPVLDNRFGPERVLGGLCVMSSTTCSLPVRFIS